MNFMMRIGNYFVIRILKSGLHGMLSASTVLLSFQGWKSGRQIEVPVNFVRTTEGVLISSKRNRIWWKNFRHLNKLTIWFAGEQISAQALLDEEPIKVKAAFEKVFELKPEWVRFYRLELNADGRVNTAALDRLAADSVVLQVKW